MRLFSTSSNSRTFYEILQVPHTASLKEIKSQYYKLCKLLHPDMKSKKPLNNSQEFQDILTAFETLKDSAKRREYDRSLALTKYREPQKNLKDFEFKPKGPDSLNETIKFWTKMENESQKKFKQQQGHEQSMKERLEDMKVFRDRVLVFGAIIIGYWLSTSFGS